MPNSHVDPSKFEPVYWRFAFKPSDGSVLLSHNHEGHPAHIRTHADLAREANEPGVVHGYAYRIGGGWRLHDYEHKPLTDPFIKRQVARALTRRQGAHVPAPSRSDASAVDFTRTHYGQPLAD